MLNLTIIDSKKDYADAIAIREAVFIVEQQVPREEEIDVFEDFSTHILARLDNKPAGTARWRKTTEGIKLERFSVLNQYRDAGVGRALVEFALEKLKDETYLYLNAQEYVIPFYQKFNFREEGEIFYEANIPHKKMVYNKNGLGTPE